MAKQTTNMSRVIGELQRIARLLNRDWFNNELPMDECIITVQSTPRSYAHFTPYIAYRVHDKAGERGGVEINIGAGTLDRKIEQVVASLSHEATHWYNWLHDVKDTSRGNVYHNKRFKDEAEKHGIIIEYDERIGWSITSPSDELIEWCIEQGLEDFRLGRNEFTGFSFGGGNSTGTGTTVKPIIPKKGNSHKLVCPVCGTIVRYTTQKAPFIICGDCNQTMIED